MRTMGHLAYIVDQTRSVKGLRINEVKIIKESFGISVAAIYEGQDNEILKNIDC